MTRKDGLPRRVYVRHSSYYYVRPGDEKWIRLSAVREGLPTMFRALAALTDATMREGRMPEVITQWLDEARAEWSPKTAKDQERIAAVMSQAFLEFRPAEVTTPVCAQYLQQWRTQPRTHNMHRIMLRRVLAFAAVQGLREGHNPVDNVPAKTLQGRSRVVTDAEIAAIKEAALQAARNGDALVKMIDLALLTGQRIGDLIGLRWQDIGEDGISVRQQKTGALLLIEWSPALRAAIAACAPASGHRIGHVLRTQSGSGYRYAGIRSAWVRACERAGVEDLHIHDLRGRAGVDALGGTEDMRAAQRLLGHAGERMTRHYVDGKYAKRAKPSR